MKPTHGDCGDGELSMDIGETDIDCGGDQCHKCEAGQFCVVDSDCKSDDCSETAAAIGGLGVIGKGTCLTKAPTAVPTTEAPTVHPTQGPTLAPTVAPTHKPSKATDAPTHAPSNAPTPAPTDAPTGKPTTLKPTKAPTMPDSGQCVLLNGEGIPAKHRDADVHIDNAGPSLTDAMKLSRLGSELDDALGWATTNDDVVNFYVDLVKDTAVSGLRVLRWGRSGRPLPERGVT